eukprot:6228259-Amphidinium_carterae.1
MAMAFKHFHADDRNSSIQTPCHTPSQRIADLMTPDKIARNVKNLPDSMSNTWNMMMSAGMVGHLRCLSKSANSLTLELYGSSLACACAYLSICKKVMEL